MTDDRTLLDVVRAHRDIALREAAIAAAEADILRERVAALEGLARRVTSAQVYEAPGDPCQGLDVGFVRALRLLYEVVTSPAPTPATDEARCGWCGGSGRIVSGFKVCPKCNGLGHQPTPEPACFLCRRTKDEHAARTDLLHTFTPEPAPRAIAYGSIPGSDDWVMADPEPGS